MVPSVALGASENAPENAAKYASALALKVLEHPIFRDYLEHTHGVPEELLADPAQ